MIKIHAAELKAQIRGVREATKKAHDEILGERVMTDLTENAITMIDARTRAGKDIQGNAFKKYSAAYAKRRAKKSRSLLPDLTFTGRMLGNMASKFVSPGKARVIFTRTEEALKAAGNNALRPFFGIEQPKEIALLSIRLDKLVGEALRRAGLA